MLQSIRKMKGQSTVEYAVLIMIIIAALLTIQQYVKRGIQGRMKSSTDDIGDQFSVGNQNALKSTHVVSKTQEEFGGAGKQGVSFSKILTPEITNTTESSNVVKVNYEYMGPATP